MVVIESGKEKIIVFRDVYEAKKQLEKSERFNSAVGQVFYGAPFANLEISRAILARGDRKCEFYWRGVKISASVLDGGFYDRFFAHEITIVSGDELRVALRIIQVQNPDTGIFVNERYEVIEVFEHIPRMRQTRF